MPKVGQYIHKISFRLCNINKAALISHRIRAYIHGIQPVADIIKADTSSVEADFSEYPAGIAHRNRIGRDIPGHDAARADHHIVTNGHTGKHHTVGTDPDIVADPDRQ